MTISEVQLEIIAWISNAFDDNFGIVSEFGCVVINISSSNSFSILPSLERFPHSCQAGFFQL